MSGPSFDDIFLAMAAASVGDGAARVALPESPDLDHVPTRLALALNVLLEDLSFRMRSAGQLAERLRILAEAARDFSASTRDLDGLLDTVVRRLASIVGDVAVVLLSSDDGQQLVTGALHARSEAAAAFAGELFAEPLAIAQHSFAQRVHATGEPFLAPTLDLEALRRITAPKTFRIMQQLGLHSLLVVPLRVADLSFGVLAMGRHEPSSAPFDDDDLTLASALADHASLAISNARIYAAERGARERYLLMFEASPQPMLVLDPTTRAILEANDAAVEQYGYSRAEIVTMLVDDLWLPAEAAVNRQIFAVAHLENQVHNVRHVKKSGAVCDVEVRAHVLTLAGRTLRLTLITDVTERLRSERARRLAETRFARLIDAGVIGIVVHHFVERSVIEINDALLDLLGYTREEIVTGAVPWKELTPPEWSKTDELAFEQLTATGAAGRREKELICKDGSRVPVLIGSAILEGTEDECISFVVDLRERKRAEAAIAHLRDALASEGVFRGFVEGAPDAVVISNTRGEMVLVNQQTERLFGYSRAELIAQPLALILPAAVAPDVHGRRKDGSEFPIEVSSSPLATEDGVLVSRAIRDVTERRAAEAALASAKDAAVAANRELEAFSYSVAHDLRGPLRGMDGFAHVLLETYGDRFDAEGQDWLNEIVSNARKMGALIDALLALARLTKSALHREPVDVSTLVREAAAKLMAAEPDRRLELRVEEGLVVEADPALARSLVANLVGNAWKFTSKMPSACIELGAMEENGERVFFVRDNGAGFDMTFADKLFGPFQRLHTVDDFPGTGIGLATVQRIVARHGGRIWAVGAVNRGATFYFSLPRGAR